MILVTFSGPRRDGRLHLNVCDFKLEMKQLNNTEQRHLTNVMNHVYGKQCGECEIEVCFNRENCEHVRINSMNKQYAYTHSKNIHSDTFVICINRISVIRTFQIVWVQKSKL